MRPVSQGPQHRLHDRRSARTQADRVVAVERLAEHFIQAASLCEKLGQPRPFALKLGLLIVERTIPSDVPLNGLLQLFRETLLGPLEIILDRRDRQTLTFGDLGGGHPFADAAEQNSELIRSAG